MDTIEKRELVIVGAGPAGLTAAVYGKRAGLDTLVLEKGKPGGQILNTSEIENWPGIKEASGFGLAQNFREHAEHFKAEIRRSMVTAIKPEDGKTIVSTEDGDIEANAVIIATGASFKKQGCPGEKKFIGKGVSYCAVCDGAFYKEFDGVFIFIGTQPNGDFYNRVVKTTEKGWIITDMDMKTSTPGIFAAGDVRDTSLRQVVTAAGDGARAAMSAFAYIANASRI